MKQLVKATLAVAALSLSACHTAADQFRDGVPTQNMVKLNVPAKSGSALTDGTGRQQGALRGDASGFYGITRGATVLSEHRRAGGAGAGKEHRGSPALLPQGRRRRLGPIHARSAPTPGS